MGLRVIIAGQKLFGAEVFRLCMLKKCEVVAVSCPIDDKYLLPLAEKHGVQIIPAGTLNNDSMPNNIDLGIAAHSFDYIGKKTRYKARIGWIGYHPSLLPRHRGKSSVEWAIRMGDAVTGGTVYWLNSGIDRGDIAYQDWCFVDPKLKTLKPSDAAKILWHNSLLPIGIKLLSRAICDIQSGKLIKKPQDDRFATFEPCTSVEPIYKPDLLMLNELN